VQIYYSPETGGFYSEALHGPRRIEAEQTEREAKAGKRPLMIDNPDCTIPADADPVSAARHDELMRAQGQGKVITHRGGKLVAVDYVPDEGERFAQRRRLRNRRLAASDWTQLGDTLTGDPLQELLKSEWAKYRQQLRDLDLSGHDWPIKPGEAS